MLYLQVQCYKKKRNNKNNNYKKMVAATDELSRKKTKLSRST